MVCMSYKCGEEINQSLRRADEGSGDYSESGRYSEARAPTMRGYGRSMDGEDDGYVGSVRQPQGSNGLYERAVSRTPFSSGDYRSNDSIPRPFKLGSIPFIN